MPPGPRPYSLRYDPEGQRLAVSSLDSPLIQIRSAETGEVQTTLTAPRTIAGGGEVVVRARGIAWHPEGRFLAAGGDDWRVYVWDVTAPRQSPAALEGHQAEVIDVAFSPRGDLLFSRGWDTTLRIWDLSTRSQLVSLPGVSFSLTPDGEQLGLERRGEVQIWEVAQGKERRTLRHHGAGKGPWSVAISRDVRLLASVGSGVRVWDLALAREIASLPGTRPQSVLFHPTAPYLIASGEDGLYRWPLQRRTGTTGPLTVGPPEAISQAGEFQRAVMSPDGRTLAFTQGHYVRVLHFGEPAAQIRFRAQVASDLDVAISPDSRWLATGGWQAEGVRVWEARTGRPVRELPVRGSSQVGFSPDGRWLATVTGAEARLWNTGSWQPVYTFPRDDPDNIPTYQAFSPDGTIVAIPLSRRVAQLVELKTGRQLARLEAPNAQMTQPMAFSPDGRLLVTKGGPELLHIWDLRLIRTQLAAMNLDW
jgi:WD40 repeat protein